MNKSMILLTQYDTQICEVFHIFCDQEHGRTGPANRVRRSSLHGSWHRQGVRGRRAGRVQSLSWQP